MTRALAVSLGFAIALAAPSVRAEPITITESFIGTGSDGSVHYDTPVPTITLRGSAHRGHRVVSFGGTVYSVPQLDLVSVFNSSAGLSGFKPYFENGNGIASLIGLAGVSDGPPDYALTYLPTPFTNPDGGVFLSGFAGSPSIYSGNEAGVGQVVPVTFAAFDPTLVPEPASIALMGCGIAGFVAVRRRDRKRTG